MVKIRGHRGAAARAPENTIQSFEQAVDTGVAAVEFDVRRAADDGLVVIHDETLDRTTDGAGYVRQHAVDAIQTLDAGGGTTVPTLDETLAYFADQPARSELLLEIKEYETVWDVYRAVRDHELLEQTVFHSFNLPALDELARIDPTTTTSYAVMEPYDGLFVEADQAGCDVLTFRYGTVTDGYLREAEAYGFATGLWDVDDQELVEAARMEPDYVGADDPKLARQLLNDAEPMQEPEGYP